MVREKSGKHEKAVVERGCRMCGDQESRAIGEEDPKVS